jgi:hypothetical protein
LTAPPPGGSKENRLKWNGYLVALYQLLNDYAALKTYGVNPAAIVGGTFTGAAVENLDKLKTRLTNSAGGDATIEQKYQGSWTGRYKFHYVGLRRDVYGRDADLMGLEIRSNWKGGWDGFRSLVEQVVTSLEWKGLALP